MEKRYNIDNESVILSSSWVDEDDPNDRFGIIYGVAVSINGELIGFIPDVSTDSFEEDIEPLKKWLDENY